MKLTWLLVLVLVIVVGWVISTYNFFVSAKARIKAAIQEIGNQLKRQAGLIPNLESSVKGYLKHEKSIFEDLTSARKMVALASKTNDIDKMAKAGSMLNDVLPRLQVVVESNPELKGSTVVTDLMNELRDTSDKVMYARRLLIDLTADYNVRLVSFPSNLLANMFGFIEQPGLITPTEGEHLNVSEAEIKSPKVQL